jgi:hypothetical protein
MMMNIGSAGLEEDVEQHDVSAQNTPIISVRAAGSDL